MSPDGYLAFRIAFTTKKVLIVIQTIVKAEDPGDEIENEVTNSETLNLGAVFSQASCKYTSFYH